MSREDYTSLPTERLTTFAAIHCGTINDRAEKMFALSAALLDRLTPKNGNEPEDYVTLSLASLLFDMLSDARARYELSECIETLENRQ